MFDWKSLFKYLFEGLAVGVSAWLIPVSKIAYMDIILIALTAAAVFAILDQFSPQVANGARQGTGFALGVQQVGFGGGSPESNQTGENIAPQPNERLCQMDAMGNCMYSPLTTLDEQRRYICKEVNGQCIPESI